MSKEDKVVEMLKTLGELEEEKKALIEQQESLDVEYAEITKKLSVIEEGERKLAIEENELTKSVFNNLTRNYSFIEEGRTEEDDMYPSSRWETTYYDFYGMSVTAYVKGFSNDHGDFSEYKFNKKLSNYTDEQLLERAKVYIEKKIKELSSVLDKEDKELQMLKKEKQELEKEYSETFALNVVKKAKLSKLIKDIDDKIEKKQKDIDDLKVKINYWLGKSDEKVLIQIKEVKSMLQSYFNAVEKIRNNYDSTLLTRQTEAKRDYNAKKESIQKRKTEIDKEAERTISVLKTVEENASLLSTIATDSKYDKRTKEMAANIQKQLGTTKTIKK